MARHILCFYVFMFALSDFIFDYNRNHYKVLTPVSTYYYLVAPQLTYGMIVDVLSIEQYNIKIWDGV